MAEIEHLSVHEAKETLGVFTCPAGTAKAQLLSMTGKGQKWIDRALESHLQPRDIWFLLDHQLWPRIGYGISSISAPGKKIEDCLGRIWWQLLPMGGIIRSAPRKVRQMSSGFDGAGCPHVGVEYFVQQIDKLLTHYGCNSSLGLKMRTSVEMIITELGISLQPFQESFTKYGKWITWSWMTSVWEKCDIFGVKVELENKVIKFPRQGDKWLMM